MNGRLVAREELRPEDTSSMRSLLGRHFEGVSEEQFAADLAAKNWVILIENDEGRLLGFSTLLLYTDRWEGDPLTVVYSGDTVVDPQAWSSSILSRTWIGAVKHLHRTHGEGRLVWLLITSGFRTYRFLPLFWRQFYPRHDRSTPPDIERLVHRLATDRFGSRYDPDSGVVCFDRPQILREHLRGIPASRLADPHVAFFARANPGHVDGDELVCFTELSDTNLTAAGRRMVEAPPNRRVS